MTRLLVFAVAALALAAPGAASARPAEDADIVRTAASAGQFKTLLRLATRAGLADDLSNGKALTVLAPTDKAFARVPASTMRKLQADRALLRRVLLYHVIAGNVPSATVVKLRSAKTLAGPAVRIRVTGNTVRINTARVTKVDVKASNGVIHVLDRVLLPPS